MSKHYNITPDTISNCEFVRELEAAAKDAYSKGAADWNAPIAIAYGQVSLEMKRIVNCHIRRGHCAACRADELRSKAATERVNSGLSSRPLPHYGQSILVSAAGC
jgi:hypothetical protein